MNVFYGFDALPSFVAPAVTVGSFDGVHGGHRVILRRLNEIARRLHGESVVITFSPHPRIVLGQADGLKLLNTLDEKIRLLSETGVDNLIVARFTEEFSRLSSEEYLQGFLVGRVGVKALVAGYNHRFGHDKRGDFAYLSARHEDLGFEICEIPRQEIDNEKVSSTTVRACIAAGDMQHAERLLTRPYPLTAVAGADGTLSDIDSYKLLPPEGSYRVVVDGDAEDVLHVTAKGLALETCRSAAAGHRMLHIEFRESRR